MYLSDPRWLWLLLLLPPLWLLHMRSLRRRTVGVPSIMLWQQMAAETSRTTHAFLRRIAVLVLKSLAAICAAAALAGLFVNAGRGERTVYVVDNSAGMTRRTGDGRSGYDRARAAVPAAALGAGRVFLAAGPQAACRALPPEPIAGPAATAVRVMQVAAGHPGSRVVVFTDRPPPDGFRPPAVVEWHNLCGCVPSVGIRDAAAVSEGLYVTLVNTFAAARQAVIEAAVNGERQGARVFTVPSGTTELFLPVNLPRIADIAAEVQIIDAGDGWSGDDYYACLHRVPPEICVTGDTGSAVIMRALAAAGTVPVRTRGPRPDSLNVISGPVEGVPPGRYLLTAPVGRVGGLEFVMRTGGASAPLVRSAEGPLLSHVDFGESLHVTLTADVKGDCTVLAAAGGRPAIGLYRADGYEAVFITFAPEAAEWFVNGPAFPVLIYNILDHFGALPGGAPTVICGTGMTVVPGEFTIRRMGESVGRADTPDGRLTPLVPGVYQRSGRPVFAAVTAPLPPGEGPAGLTVIDGTAAARPPAGDMFRLLVMTCIVLSTLVFLLEF